jgi:sugar phosphate isomerase/epimerase
MYSRRDFGKTVLAALPVSAVLGKINSTVNGVQLGACTYSFRDLPHTAAGDAIDPVIQALKECNAGICELFSPQVEPANGMTAPPPRSMSNLDPQARMAAMRARMNSPEAKKAREDLRQWRLSTPMDHFKAVRKKFDDAGINVYAYTLNFREDFTDEELEKCFEQTKAMGVKIIAASTQLSVAPRLVPLAEKHKIYVAMHGHSNTKDPNEFSSPETFQKALAMSKYFKINLDIGHFSAAGFDPVAYIQEQHANITHLHLKDRKKNDGPNTVWGEGDTPIKQVLSLLKEKKYPIPALVEYEYKGTGSSVEEVQKCMSYMKNALA